MKAIEFPEVNVRIAEKQEEYETLPVHVDMSDNRTKTTMCFELNEEERKQVAETGRIWVQMLTFGYSFHPISMSFLKPEGFTDPQKPSTHIDDLDISIRCHRLLKENDFCHLEDLCSYRRSSMLKLRNFGEVSLRELDTILAEHGLSWLDEAVGETFKCRDCGKTLPMSKYSKLFDSGICVDCEPF